MYRLNFIHKKEGIDILGTNSFCTLDLAWKAAKNEVKIEKFRYTANYLAVPKVKKTSRWF